MKLYEHNGKCIGATLETFVPLELSNICLKDGIHLSFQYIFVLIDMAKIEGNILTVTQCYRVNKGHVITRHE